MLIFIGEIVQTQLASGDICKLVLGADNRNLDHTRPPIERSCLSSNKLPDMGDRRSMEVEQATFDFDPWTTASLFCKSFETLLLRLWNT